MNEHDRFRIAIDVEKEYYDGGPLEGVPITETDVLWSGDALPSEETIASALEHVSMSGYLVLPTSMSQLPGSKDYLRIESADNIRIQKKRWHRLGWKTLQLVDPAARKRNGQ